jgi:hypothetical protein
MPKYYIEIEMEQPTCCVECCFDYDTMSCVAVMTIEDGEEHCKHHDCDVCEEVEEWCPLKRR